MKAKNIIVLFVFALCLMSVKSVKAEYVSGQCRIQATSVDANGKVTIRFQTSHVYDINYDIPDIYVKNPTTERNPNAFNLMRSDQKDGTYVVVSCGMLGNNYEDLIAEDTSAVVGQTYFYKIQLTNTISQKDIGDPTDAVRIVVIPSASPIEYVRATKANTFSIKWAATANIDGYDLYAKELTSEQAYGVHNYSQYENDDFQVAMNYVMGAEVPYVKIATLDANATSYTYKNVPHGLTYLFALRTYKMINGTKVYGNIMYCAHGVMDYYFCANAENTKYAYKWPKNRKAAEKMMTTIKVKTWDYKNHAKHKGAKKSRYQWITVNKKYAETIKLIYKEIYKDKSKPPIYEAGSYRWRPEESTWSYHTVGTAIDMNCNENPYYSYNAKGKRVISVGSFYKPKTNGYSMPRNGVIEKTFAKYGFVRLDNDLMHYNAEEVYFSNSNYK